LCVKLSGKDSHTESIRKIAQARIVGRCWIPSLGRP